MNPIIEQIKETVATEKGYPSWKEMEDWVINNNSPVVVAQLLLSAMEEVLIKNKYRILEHIYRLELESFEGWSNDAKNGYLTACSTIKMFIRK
jgi:hypothetical protein